MFDETGFDLIENVLSANEVTSLQATLQQHKLTSLKGGVRRIEQLLPEVLMLSKSEKIMQIAREYLNNEPAFVRAIYFDKTPENNWYVTWHQDRTVTVSERFTEAGWGPWSLKSGIWHVQPPLAVLESMVTIRLHLDPSTIGNGCLKFIPGSHQGGIIKSSEIHDHINISAAVYCEAPVGSAIIMKPHIFHASEKAMEVKSRRVLHFEYAAYKLPAGVTWSI